MIDRLKSWLKRKDFPHVSVTLAGINVIVFLLLTVQENTKQGLVLLDQGALDPEAVLDRGEWYRIITCMFLHFNIEHLMNNMVMLVGAGMQLEHALGKVKYVLLYFLSGMGGSLLSLVIMYQSDKSALSAGASGAVFGIVGALLWVAIRNHGRFEKLTTRGVLIMIGLSLYFGFTSTGIDNWGHIGGIVSGFVWSILLYRAKANIELA